MRLAKHQAGMGFIGWVLVLALVGFMAVFFLKLTPVYLEYFTVRSVLQGFRTESGFGSAEEVRASIAKRFRINDVSRVSASDVVIEPAAGGYNLRLDYEVRVPFVHNISFLVEFSEKGEIRGGGG